jgi:hypothetical protein
LKFKQALSSAENLPSEIKNLIECINSRNELVSSKTGYLKIYNWKRKKEKNEESL